MNKEVVVGIFAHPDDESMGPGGTLAKYSQDQDVYLICATQGEKGGMAPDLASVRTKELQEAAKILGVKEVFFLDFPDGGLTDQNKQKLMERVDSILKKLNPQTVVTFEPRGLTGHQDHKMITQITQELFRESKTARKLLLYCMSTTQRGLMKDYFIEVPEGYTVDQIDQVEDVSAWWKTKIKAIQCHHSQQEDVDRVLKELDHLPQEEFFLIQTKA